MSNRASMTASLPGAPSTYSGTTSYGYDTRNELTAETRTGSGAGNYANGFSYDSAENPQVFRSELSTGANTFSVDNQTTSFTGSSGNSLGSFGYDGNGNPTTYKGATLAFDPENRMTGYGTVLTNGYGPDDLRAWKQGSSGTTYFLYTSMNQPVCEFNASGTLTATNTFGYVGLVSRRVGSTSVFYTFDPQGSVAQRLTSSGGIVSSDTGDAFGSRATTGGGDVFGYIGQWGYYSDSETGLCLCQHRYYDPATGRFLTRDPIGYRGGVNLYNYCHNNAVNGVDASGYASTVGGGILDGLGACGFGIIGDVTGRGSDDTCALVGTCAGAALVTYIDIQNPEIVTNPVTECLSNVIGAVLSNAVTAACNYLQNQCCYKPNWPCLLGNTLAQSALGCIQGLANPEIPEADEAIKFVVDRAMDTFAAYAGAKIDGGCPSG